MMRWRRSLLKSFADARKGITYTVRTQRNARIHLAATLVVIALSLWFGITALEWTAILLAIGLVWTAELLNTAIESVVDLVSPDEHELARISKDVASGGVLIAAVVALAVGMIVFGPRLWGLIN